jgi:hypothetical protein
VVRIRTDPPTAMFLLPGVAGGRLKQRWPDMGDVKIISEPAPRAQSSGPCRLGGLAPSSPHAAKGEDAKRYEMRDRASGFSIPRSSRIFVAGMGSSRPMRWAEELIRSACPSRGSGQERSCGD